MGRCEGFLAQHCRIMSKKAGGNPDAQGGSGFGISGVRPSLMRAIKIDGFMVWKGASQNASSQKMTPRAYTSVQEFADTAWNNSGAHHCIVPWAKGDDTMLTAELRRWMAAPKSHILAMRSEVSMTFRLFKSPWVMKRLWR